MDRHYSTLELSKYDETARAPERDYDATAFELDTSALAPETVPDTTPEVSYDGTLPEAHGNEKPTAENFHTNKLAGKLPWIVLGLLLAAAIAVGVSVGIWHRREHSLHKPTSISSPPAPPNPKTTPHPNITHAPQYILNDTSLAAVSLSNGDRHLFFQDITGLVRRAVRVESNGQWNTSPNLNASTDPALNFTSRPKNYTPLTATGPTFSKDVQMSLFYISESNTLSSIFLEEGVGSWVPDGQFGNYSTPVGTRSLSISLFPTANTSSNFNFDENSTTNVALLFYEDPNGKVSALLHRVVIGHEEYSKSVIFQQDQWIDITSQESKGLPNEFRNTPGFNYSNAFHGGAFSRTLYEADPIAVYNTPFLSAPNFFGSVGAIFDSPPNLPVNATSTLAGDNFFNIAYEIGINGSGNFSLLGSAPLSKDSTSIHQSDIAAFSPNSNAIWINGTQAALIPGSIPNVALPSNRFPFKRLASVTLADGSAYLYHQMNGTTFAEEQWDDGLHDWVSTEYITVSDS